MALVSSASGGAISQHLLASFPSCCCLSQSRQNYLSAAGAAQISGFSSFTSLTLLSMAGNRLGDAASFEMSSLAGLLTTGDSEAVADAPDATLRRLQPGVMFPLLQVLRLQENSIRSMQGLQLFGFTGLQLAFNALNFAGARVGHKYPCSVKWCPVGWGYAYTAAMNAGLRSLDLHGNKLTRVDGLQTLHSLRELILDHNILKFLDPNCFASVPRLRRLHLGHNGLRSLAHLSNLTRLQFLHFGSNRITEVTELDRLTNLVSLTEVWLTDNLVAKKQWYRALLLSKCQHVKVTQSDCACSSCSTCC